MSEKAINPAVIQQGIGLFNQDRQETEVDLVDFVRSLLIQSGLSLNVQEFFNKDRRIVDASTRTTDVQRFLLNQYFNMQLMNASVSSIDQRAALLSSGDIRDWMVLFRERVLPFLIEQDLPRAI